MTLPAYIRYFATTDNSAIGALALELCKSMLKVAPVRLVTMTSVLVDEWLNFARLTTTPMVGSFVNVVACDPSRWTWTQRVPMPDKDTWQVGIQNPGEMLPTPPQPVKVEYATSRASLYTADVRNVLYAVAPPRSKVELEAGLLFETILVPNHEHKLWWQTHGQRETFVLGYPMLDGLVRAAITGTSDN